jgi:broad specificity phosphatase PhoE
MRFGSWEGMTWPEIVARSPEARNEAEMRTLRPEGGESFDELCARVKAAVDRLKEAAPAHGCALAVTHAGPLHALLRVLGGMSEEESLDASFTPGNSMRYARSQAGWKIL